MTNYEKQLYDLIATISNTDAPIAFKGGLITHLVLQENGYEKICRMTSDIDADWMGESFDENTIEARCTNYNWRTCCQQIDLPF